MSQNNINPKPGTRAKLGAGPVPHRNEVSGAGHEIRISNLNQRGVSLYIIFMIMTMLFGIGLGTSAVLLSQLDTLRGIGYSVLAFYAVDAGIDRVLYIDQKDCADEADRIGCLHSTVDPLGTQTLSNSAQYILTIESPGGACTASTYCVKSVGTYQQARRAVRIGR